jgi:hypothetical protein
VINSEAAKALYKTMAGRTTNQPKDLSREWHSDGSCIIFINFPPLTGTSATFEECPSDFSCLMMEETPANGGDTLWCSGYEMYALIFIIT